MVCQKLPRKRMDATAKKIYDLNLDWQIISKLVETRENQNAILEKQPRLKASRYWIQFWINRYQWSLF
jgi:hypothetical protein